MLFSVRLFPEKPVQNRTANQKPVYWINFVLIFTFVLHQDDEKKVEALFFCPDYFNFFEICQCL